jgi:nitrite reductase/ring-hydroxylating ferredoxin subunit
VTREGVEGYEAVARADELSDGAPLGVETSAGERVCLVRVGGEVCAFGDACTHQAFPMSAGDVLPDGTIQCPWHGARFDCATGAVLGGPAREPLTVYQVRVADGMVWVGPKKNAE